jgi:DNA-binding transcriptional LysR family regulator
MANSVHKDRISRQIKLRDLHTLSLVVRHGSMARAAAQIGVSQPAVSEAIAQLEYLLGVQLLERSPKGVEPTAYGRALLKRSTVMFDELQQGIEEISFLTDPTSGELRIGCVESISAAILPTMLETFSAKFPHVSLYVDYVPTPTFELPTLRDRQYDLIIGRLPGSLQGDRLTTDLDVEYLFNDPIVVAAGAHTPWAKRKTLELAELAEAPWILTAPQTWNYKVMVEAFRAKGLDLPPIKLTTFSVHLRTQLLANGPYVTAFPKSVLLFNADRFALKQLPVDLPARPWPVVVITLKNRDLNPIARLFIQHLREFAGTFAESRPSKRKPSAS